MLFGEKTKSHEAKTALEEYGSFVPTDLQEEIQLFLKELGDSPLELSDSNCKKAKRLFPIPSEHRILWADCEFDLRCSGIICTDKGCFIKTNVGALDSFRKAKREENGGKSTLYYFRWDMFTPSLFCERNENNYVLKVDPKCQERFLSVCFAFKEILEREEGVLAEIEAKSFSDYQSAEIGAVHAVASLPNGNLQFIDSHVRNTVGRHGFFAEQANNLADRFRGRRATVVGGDNAKNGADRKIDRVFSRDLYIQTKYYKTAEGSLNAGFGSDGYYKYIDPTDSSRLMQLEVPKDQYLSVLEGFKQKILAGKVVDGNGRVITDPDEAYNLVRRGNITYQQSVNLAKAGNIDSITYDIKTGIVNCTFAFGISCAVTILLSYQGERNIKKALQEGVKAGAKVFGLTMINHVLLSQLYRTASFQNFSGNVLIRDTAITSAVSLAVYSIPAVYNLLSNNISFGQFLKNTAVLGGSILGGAVGSAGLAAIGKRVGGTVLHVGGGLIGGLIGAAGGAKLVKAATDVIKEDDGEIFLRLLTAIISAMAVEYMLTEKEVDRLSKRLNDISESDMKRLLKDYRHSSTQEETIRSFLEPYFHKTVTSRKKVKKLNPADLFDAWGAIAET